MSGGRSPDYIRNPPGYRIVFDPIPVEEGGFSQESIFSKIEHEEMLGHNSYTIGTILRGAKGALWKVMRGAPNWYGEPTQKLKPWRKE